MHLLWCILTVSLAFVTANSGEQLELARLLLPKPQEIGPPEAKEPGAATTMNSVVVCLQGLGEDGQSSRIYRAAERISQTRLPMGSSVVMAAGSCGEQQANEGSVMVVMSHNPRDRADNAAWNEDGYELEVSNGRIAIQGDDRGLFYGLITLVQVMVLRSQLSPAQGSAWVSLVGDERLPPGISIPPLLIRDWPSVPNRGVMLDVSRNRVHSMQTLKHVVDLISHTKMTQLQLYTEHTFQYQGHPNVWEGTGALSRSDIEELAEYCHARFVELVPNQQSLGHMQHWLKHPTHRHTAEDPAGQQALYRGDYCCSMWHDELQLPYSLAPNNDSLALLESLYDQLLPAFRHTSSINVGLDETFDLGTRKSWKEAEQHGRSSVYMRFLLAIHSILRKRRRTMQFWGDMISGSIQSIKRVPKDAIVLEWGYEAGSPFAQKGAVYHNNKVRYYNCPGTSSWNTIGGRTDNALVNQYRAVEAAKEFGAEGVLVTDWGDNGHLQPLFVSYLGFLSTADFSWNAEAAEHTVSSASTAFARFSAAIDRLVVADSAGIIGKLLLEIGMLYSKVGHVRITNRSALFNLVVLPNRDATAPMVSVGMEITREGLETCHHEISELARRLEQSRMACSQAVLLKREILWVARMLGVACKIGLLCVEHGHQRCDYQRLRPDAAQAVGTELRELVDELRDIWPARAAVGSGLEDSVARLMHTVNLLMGRRGTEGGQRKDLVKTLLQGLGFAGREEL